MTTDKGNAVPVLLLIIASLVVAAGQSTENTHFFPELGAEQNTRFCDVPKYQNPNKPEPFSNGNKCNVQSTDLSQFTDDDIDRLAYQYAPILFFHPLERYSMSSINRTLEDPRKGKIFIDDVVHDNLNQEALLSTTRDFNYAMFSSKFHIERNLNDVYIAGDGFDEEGLSRAQVYYNVFHSGDGTLTFNYFFWFPLSGPASLGLISSINGTNQYVPFQLPPWGTKEGDWESISVTACGSIVSPLDSESDESKMPLAVTYRQKDDESVLVMDCTIGECTFFRDSITHPVGFVALGTHEIYPSSVNEIIYTEVPNLEFLVNLQAVLVIHRTAYADDEGKFRYFAPSSNASNLLRLPEQVDIPEKAHESDYWVAFGGRFGRIEELSSSIVGELPTCLDNATSTSAVDCPTREENGIFTLLMQILQVYPPESSFVEAASIVFDYLLDRFTLVAQGSFGPAASAHYQARSDPINAPIWKQLEEKNMSSGDEFCRYLVDRIPDTTRFPIEIEPIPFISHIAFITVMVLCFVGINIFIVLFLRRRFLRRNVLEVDDVGNLKVPSREKRRSIFAYAYWFTASYVMALAGGIVFAVGYSRMSVVPLVGYSRFGFQSVDIFIFVMGVSGFIADTCLLLLVWLVASDTWLSVQRKYYHLKGDLDGVARCQWNSHHKRSWRSFEVSFPQPNATQHAILFSLVFVSFFLSVVMVASGVYRVSMAYVFGHVCRASAGSLDGVCFTPPWSEQIFCGENFETFCKQWVERGILLQLWGGFALVISHYYIVTFAAMSSFSAEHIQRALALYQEKAIMAKTSMRKTAKLAETNIVIDSEEIDNVHDA